MRRVAALIAGRIHDALIAKMRLGMNRRDWIELAAHLALIAVVVGLAAVLVSQWLA